MRVLGLDISLNHGAVVELTNGKRSWAGYYTNVAGVASRWPTGARLPAPPSKDGDKQQYQMERLAWVEAWLSLVIQSRRPDFAGIEDYALRAEQGAHQLGEVGGAARMLLWRMGVPFRKHDPISVKMFVTHDGTAQKDLIERSVIQRWGEDFSEVNAKALPGKKQSRTSSEDLADAFAVAKLVDVEQQIRSGKLTLDKLGHDKERQVFNRVTKTYPTSLLAREWIHNPSGSFDGVSSIEARLSRAIARAQSKDKLELVGFLEKIMKGSNGARG